MKNLPLKDLTTISLLAVLILISGSFKIPSPVAGGEFQLSAPIAVLICACFGFKRYIIAGIIASALGMMLGVHNIFSIIIQMSFRLVTGATMLAFGTNLLTVILSGPLGTFLCPLGYVADYRCQLMVLTAAAAPGMIFTAITAGLFYKPATKLLHRLAVVH